MHRRAPNPLPKSIEKQYKTSRLTHQIQSCKFPEEKTNLLVTINSQFLSTKPGGCDDGEEKKNENKPNPRPFRIESSVLLSPTRDK